MASSYQVTIPSGTVISFLSTFATSPNQRVNILLKQAHAHGTSKIFVERAFYAPAKAFSAFVISLIDVPSYPVCSLHKAIVDILDFSDWHSAPVHDVGTGIVNGLRSLYQVALIASTIVVGIIMPLTMYGALPVVKDNPEVQGEAPDKKALAKSEESIKELQNKIETLNVQNTDLNTQLATLQGTLTQTGQQNTELQQKLGKINDECEKLEMQLHTLQSNIGEKNQQLANQGKQLKTTKTELLKVEELKQQLQALFKEKSQLLARIKNLEEKFQSVNDKVLEEGRSPQRQSKKRK